MTKRRTRRVAPREPDESDFDLYEPWEFARLERGEQLSKPSPTQSSRQTRDRRSWKRLTSPDYCFEALRTVTTKPGGNSAGIDEIRPYDVSPRAAGVAAKLLSETLRDASYRPAKLLPKTIPKGDPAAKKFRELDVPTVVDRAADHLIAWAVRAAIGNTFLAMTPSDQDTLLSDVGQFDDGPQTNREALLDIEAGRLTLDCYAVRGHGTREFLADLGAAIDMGNTFVGNHDIRDAYPSMPIEPCLDALEQLDIYEHAWFAGHKDEARHAVRAILTNGGRRTKGLPQGLTLSEVALDARLHFDHDLPVRDILRGKDLEGETL